MAISRRTVRSITRHIRTKSIVGGILEIIIAGLFIGAGIVYICLEKSPYLGGDITGLILMIIAGVLGVFDGFICAWMFLYAAIALVIGFGFYIWHRIIGTDDIRKRYSKYILEKINSLFCFSINYQ